MLHSLIALDERVFLLMHRWDAYLPSLWHAIAVGGVYLIPLILVWFWFARRRETALFAFLTGLVAWQVVNRIISHFVIRQRPEDFYHYAVVKQEGLFHRPEGSFPSDHTGFMTAIGLIFLLAGEPGPAWLVFAIELVTVIARIVIAFHWPGDILGGILVGLVTGAVAWWARRPLEAWIVQPLVTIARRIGL